MKSKNNAGFSLVEVLVAIVLLGVMVVPICSSLVLTFRMNEKTDSMLQAQLAVSSAVETLLAEGIDETKIDVLYDGKPDLKKDENAEEEERKLPTITYNDGTGRFSEVVIKITVIPEQFVDPTETDSYPHPNAYKDSYDCYEVTVISNFDNSISVETTIREKEAGT